MHSCIAYTKWFRGSIIKLSTHSYIWPFKQEQTYENDLSDQLRYGKRSRTL